MNEINYINRNIKYKIKNQMSYEDSIWSLSILIYDKNRGYLFPKHKNGKYMFFVGRMKRDESDMLKRAIESFIEDTKIYDNYYFMRRAEKYFERKYMDKYGELPERDLFEKLKKREGNTYRKLLVKIIKEWFGAGIPLYYDIQLFKNESNIRHRILLLEIDSLKFANDINALYAIPYFYKKYNEKGREEIEEIEWININEMRKEECNDMVGKFLDELVFM